MENKVRECLITHGLGENEELFKALIALQTAVVRPTKVPLDTAENPKDLKEASHFVLDSPSGISAKSVQGYELWPLVRNRLASNSFAQFETFVANALVNNEEKSVVGSSFLNTSDGYNTLKDLTVAFLKIGSMAERDKAFKKSDLEKGHPDLAAHPVQNKVNRWEQFSDQTPLDGQEKERLGLPPATNISYDDINKNNIQQLPVPNADSDINKLGKLDENLYDHNKIVNPLLLELIWSYWTEESLLVQSCNALCLRFQNRRSPILCNPLTNLAVDPLKPLANIIWGFVENEQNRLSLQRRAFEYENEYGLSLAGRALGRLVPIESRTAFLSAFHHLIQLCAVFYQESSDMTVKPDAYPIATALKEVQMILAEGAINQFGDMPFQARVEMMMMQWLMSRKEVKEFVGARKSIPYPEPWMPCVDTIKRMQGWSDVSSMHFCDLARCSEQIILTIRHDDWQGIEQNENRAKAWCNYWKSEIQAYIHAYRAVTGVDLNKSESVKAKMPSFYFAQHELELKRRQNCAQVR